MKSIFYFDKTSHDESDTSTLESFCVAVQRKTLFSNLSCFSHADRVIWKIWKKNLYWRIVFTSSAEQRRQAKQLAKFYRKNWWLSLQRERMREFDDFTLSRDQGCITRRILNEQKMRVLKNITVNIMIFKLIEASHLCFVSILLLFENSFLSLSPHDFSNSVEKTPLWPPHSRLQKIKVTAVKSRFFRKNREEKNKNLAGYIFHFECILIFCV